MPVKFKPSERKKKDNFQILLRRVYDRFVKIKGQHREIALGFGLGIFIGMTPTMGIQMPIAVFIVALGRGSGQDNLLKLYKTFHKYPLVLCLYRSF